MKKRVLILGMVILAVISLLTVFVEFLKIEIKKNDLLHFLEKEEYKLAVEFVDKHPEALFLTNESSETMIVLNEKIDLLIEDLQNCKYDTCEIDETLMVYNAVASAKGLSTEKLEQLNTAVEYCEDVFWGYLEKGEYQLANAFIENNSGALFVKEQIVKIVDMLDRKIDSLIIDLQNEKCSEDIIEEVSILYNTIAELEGISKEKLEQLDYAVNMYNQINDMRFYLESEYYDSFAYQLIASSYSNDEIYMNLLVKYITEEEKKRIVFEINEQLNDYFDSSDRYHTLMRMPSVISQKTVLSDCLFTDAERKKLVDRINKYNESKKCKVDDCMTWAPGTFCSDHKCENENCKNLKKESLDYCANHICRISGCEKYSAGDLYCYSHECLDSDCKKYAGNGKYCNNHANNESSSKDYTPPSSYVQTVKCNFCNGTGSGSVQYRSDHYKSKLPCDVCGGKGNVEITIKY